MKIVREHINEKFTKDFDPIKDLGIGYVVAKRPIKTHYDQEEDKFMYLFPSSYSNISITQFIISHNIQVNVMPPPNKTEKFGEIYFMGHEKAIEDLLRIYYNVSREEAKNIIKETILPEDFEFVKIQPRK